ncbi:hypothetical protein SUGI_1114980 [Cryptomeria japonica]|nr:hypothetical protein SUGI_1114980 [Cryptomeria japonica]
MDVTVTDSVLVKPVNSTPHHQLWVSNIDLVMVRVHSAIAYIYRRPPNGDSNVAEILKDALSKVLVDFYPLAGRLIVDASGRIAVDCNGEGALFVEAMTNSSIDDFGDFTSPSQLTTLVPSATYENGFTISPFLMIQVRFSWCDVVRGLQVHLLPQVDRSPLRARNPPRVNFPHEEFAPPPTLLQEEIMKRPQLEDIAGEIVSNPLWYSAEKILESISKIDDGYLRSGLDFLELQPDLNAVVRRNDMYKCPNMVINSWTCLPFYDADFGWGRPTMMGHP